MPKGSGKGPLAKAKPAKTTAAVKTARQGKPPKGSSKKKR
jgi:hypothetical protein